MFVTASTLCQIVVRPKQTSPRSRIPKVNEILGEFQVDQNWRKIFTFEFSPSFGNRKSE